MIRKTVNEAIASYESFMDTYYAAMNGLSNGDFTDYMVLLEQYDDILEEMEKLEDDLTDEDSLYYMEVSTRILQKSYDQYEG